eukprot:s1551_g18.t1
MSNQTADVLVIGQNGKVICSGSEVVCAFSNYLITTSLGGLTGVKGSIPILMVAVGSRISDRCPLHLEDTWLDSWLSIGLLSSLLLFEVLADCLPAVASILDVVMLLGKPALGVALALSPSYGQIYGVSSAAGWLAAASAALLAVLVALMKATWTLACDGSAAGLCSVLRSGVESCVTSLLSFLVFMLGLLAASILLVLILVALGRFLSKRLCQQEDASSASSSESGSSDSDETRQ